MSETASESASKPSLAERLAKLPKSERDAWIAGLTDEQARGFAYDWRSWARPEQLPPVEEFRVWLVLAGRGWGKSRTGAEWIRERVYQGDKRIALLAPTASDLRDTVIEGESGLLSVFPPSQRPRYEPSKRRVTFHTGAIAIAYSGEEPERLRGQQSSAAWVDELAAMDKPSEAMDQLLFGLRLGKDPRAVVTTTPKPIKAVRDLSGQQSTVVTRGSTYANRANLAPAFFEQIINRYEGTSLGEQEIRGILLDAFEGALWSRELLESSRASSVPQMTRTVLAIDPAVSASDESDFTGLTVCGLGEDGKAYVLYSTGVKLSPDGWAKRAVGLYNEYECNVVVAEKNQGGALVEANLRTQDSRLPVKLVHATKGKRLRAEPVASLFEQGKALLYGTFETLEYQMSTYLGEPGEDSPDQLDSMSYAMTELMLDAAPTPRIRKLALG